MLTEPTIYSSATHEPIVTFYDFNDNVVPPTYSTSTVKVTGTPQGPRPTVKTLPPKIIKSTLPPKFKTVTLKAKVVKVGPAAATPTPTPTPITTSIPFKYEQPVTYTTVTTSAPLPVPTNTSYSGPVTSITYIYPPTPANDFETFGW